MKSKKTIIIEKTKKWLNKKGELHRKNGPAIIHPCGTKEWWVNGKCHRENGAAVIYADKYKEYYINDELITEKEFFKRFFSKNKAFRKTLRKLKKEYDYEDYEDYTDFLRCCIDYA